MSLALRFKELIDGLPAQKPANNPAAGPPVAELVITRGLHKGAQLALHERDYTLGRSRENDIILRDQGIAAVHARVVYRQGEPILFPTDSGNGTAFPRQLMHAKRGLVTVLYDLGPTSVALKFRARTAAAQQIAGSTSKTWSLKQTMLIGGLTTLCFTGTLLGFAYSQHQAEQANIKTQTAKASSLTKRLRDKGFSDVTIEVLADGRLRSTGYVATPAQNAGLAEFLLAQGLGRDQIVIRVGEDIAARVRSYLSSEELRVAYVGGGRLSISGSTKDSALKNKILTIAQEMRGAVAIEDKVAYVEDKAMSKPKSRPLTVKITNVMPGEGGFFQTDAGAKYFVGSVMPDGAQVVEISFNRIVFRLEERDVIYSLE
jgi:hypothetical protein